MPSPPTTSPYAQDHDDGIERPSKRLRATTSETTSQAQELGLMRKTVQDSHVSFLGSASGIHFIRSVYAAIGDKEPADHQNLQSPETDLVPGEDDRLDTEMTDTATALIWRPDEVTADPARTSFTFNDLVAWSQSYFDHWFPAYPFLHAPSTLEFFERFAASQGTGQGDDKYALELAILRSIMSISLADRRQSGTVTPRPIPHILVFTTFKAAMESVQLTLSTRTSTLSLQAVLSVQLFLSSMLRHNAASRFGGLITRMVYHLGLHRCPARYPSFAPQDVMIRKRIFWSVYCMDRYINQSLGLPLTLRDDDTDVCFPDCEIHGSGSHVIDLDKRLILLNLLSKHAEVKGLSMELLHKSISHRQSSHDQSLLIQSKLTKWSNEVEAYLDLDDDEQAPFSAFHGLMLTVLKQECIIAFNRPLLTLSRKSSDHAAALHTCVSAARSIISSLSDFLDRSRRPTSEYAVPLLWPSFTWAIWMSTFILVFATIEEEIPKRVALRLTDRSLKILKHLSLRGSVWPNACEIAIRELRSKLLEPDSVLQNTVNRSSNSMSPRRGTSSTARPEKRPVVPRTRQLSARAATQNGSQNLTNRSDQARATTSNFETNPSSDWMGRDSFQPTNTDVPDLSPAASQFSTTHVLRNSWNMQQAPYWLENVTDAAADQIDIFQGFEIPFWMGDDQYNSLIGNG